MSSRKNKITGGVGELKTAKTKWNQSNFFVTVNPNVTKKELSPKKLDGIIHEMFSNVVDYVKILSANKDVKYNAVDAEYGIEVGKDKHRVHAHILVRIQHNSKIQLDLTKIRKQLKSDLGFDGTTG
jgi:uncharacterized membrane protein YfhO